MNMMKKSSSFLVVTAMTAVLIAASLLWSSSGMSEGGGAVVSIKNSPFDVSDGTRIEIPEKGFSITPPMGWEVHRKYPNTTLLMQIPYKKGLKYQRTIQVMRFSGGVPIDDVSGREFNEIIEQKFSQAEGSISDYRMRNHMVTTMENGSSGILFYSEFMLQGTPIMQAHILLSSSNYHFLLTYTDLASHFEGEEASQFLTTAWESMVSTQLDSEAPVRMRVPVLFAFSFAFAILMVLLILAVRKYKAGREYEGEVEDSVAKKSTKKKSEKKASAEFSEVESKLDGSYHVMTHDTEFLNDENIDEENDGNDEWHVSSKGNEESEEDFFEDDDDDDDKLAG